MVVGDVASKGPLRSTDGDVETQGCVGGEGIGGGEEEADFLEVGVVGRHQRRDVQDL